jgi:hypothetical protein
MSGRTMLLAAALLMLAACGRSEQPLLDQFFGASRLRDRTALQRISTVTFEPLQDGIVRTFRITGVSGERRDGPAIQKDVTVDAAVVLPDGQLVHKTIVVTMQRPAAGEPSAWAVTGFKAAAGRQAPPS